MSNIPNVTELVAVSEPFVGRDGDRWFVLRNIDYRDGEGFPGMTTEYLADPHGYDTEEDAELAALELQ